MNLTDQLAAEALKQIQNGRPNNAEEWATDDEILAIIQAAIEKATTTKDEAIRRLHNRVNYVRVYCDDARSKFDDWQELLDFGYAALTKSRAAHASDDVTKDRDFSIPPIPAHASKRGILTHDGKRDAMSPLYEAAHASEEYPGQSIIREIEATGGVKDRPPAHASEGNRFTCPRCGLEPAQPAHASEPVCTCNKENRGAKQHSSHCLAANRPAHASEPQSDDRQRYELALSDSQRRGELLDQQSADTKRLDWLIQNGCVAFHVPDVTDLEGARRRIDTAMSHTKEKA